MTYIIHLNPGLPVISTWQPYSVHLKPWQLPMRVTAVPILVQVVVASMSHHQTAAVRHLRQVEAAGSP